MKKVFIYTLDEQTIEKIVETYIDYVTNPYSELRQRDEYWMSRVNMMESVGVVTNPMPPERRALRYKWNPLLENDEEPLVWNLPTPQKNTLRVHVIVLLDIIYRRSMSNDDITPSFNASILQEAFRNYAYLIEVLRAENIIMGATYSGIELVNPESFERQECKNKQVLADIEAFHQRAAKQWKERMKQAESICGKSFIEKYNKNLEYYALTDKDAALGEINDENCETEKSRLYYMAAIENFGEKRKYQSKLEDAPDINGRFYHIATKTPSAIRKHTNIKFSVDARNSQLVLFNYFLLNYYIHKDISIFTSFSKYNTNVLKYHLLNYSDKIDSLDYSLRCLSNTENNDKLKDSISSISKFSLSNSIDNSLQYCKYSKLYYLILNHIYNTDIYSSNTNHIYYKRIQYDMQELCNLLKHNGFKEPILNKVRAIPTDVFRYIYQSSHGLLWDNFAKKYGMERKRVKAAGFGNIFYSHLHSIVPDTEIRESFKKEFKNVYKVLSYYKAKFQKECFEAGLVKIRTRSNGLYTSYKPQEFIGLSHKLTQLESAIFHDILSELFKIENLKVIGIHDAVEILNDEIDAELVQFKMNEIYTKYGLVATLKVE